jgi:hypothetical protein
VLRGTKNVSQNGSSKKTYPNSSTKGLRSCSPKEYDLFFENLTVILVEEEGSIDGIAFPTIISLDM